MNQQLKDELITNCIVAAKSISSYVVVGVTAAAGWYLGLSPEAQQAFYVKYPMFVDYAPWISGAAWLVAKLWPQPSLTKTVVERHE